MAVRPSRASDQAGYQAGSYTTAPPSSVRTTRRSGSVLGCQYSGVRSRLMTAPSCTVTDLSPAPVHRTMAPSVTTDLWSPYPSAVNTTPLPIVRDRWLFALLFGTDVSRSAGFVWPDSTWAAA